MYHGLKKLFPCVINMLDALIFWIIQVYVVRMSVFLAFCGKTYDYLSIIAII